MDPVLYIFLNKGLGMSTGKSAAQAAHAAVEAYKLTMGAVNSGNQTAQDVERAWYEGGHYKKIVLEARDRHQLRDIERYLNDRRFRTALIIDEGHTEIAAFSPTALGVELVDKDNSHVAATFGEFKLYRDEQPQEPQRSWLWSRYK